ncbi:MAG: sterol desaturase family protein [Pseudomonadota bacterium]
MVEFFASRADAWVTMIWKPHTIAAIAFLCLLLLIDLARRGWQFSWSRRIVAGILATLAIFHFNFLFAPLVWLCWDRIKQLYALLGIPSVPTAFWADVPVWALVPFAIIVHDFANYWNHRLMHRPLLWPVHAIHHSDPDVTGLTTYRIHMLEGLVMWTSYTVLLSWLGLPQDAIGLGAVFVILHNIYVHVNVDWDHGPLRLLIASPRFHRWHHADVAEAHGKNLANVLPLWDWMFGTYYCPGPCRERMGAAGVPENDVVKLILWPWQEWTRMALVRVRSLAANLTVRRPQGEATDARG